MNATSRSAPRRCFPWRFGLQTLLIAILLVSVLLAWWRDHVQLTQRLELQEMRLRSMEAAQRRPRTAIRVDNVVEAFNSGGGGFGGGGFGHIGFGGSTQQEFESRFATAAHYLDYLKSEPNASAADSTFWLLNRASWADQAVPLLVDLLKSGDPKHRHRAALAFAEFRTTDDEVIPHLVPLLDDPEPEVQRSALAAIVQHGQAATDAVPALQRHAQSMTSPIAVDALLTLDVILLDFSIESLLIKLLDHQDPTVQMQAVRALPDHLDAAKAEEILTKMFHREKNAELREEIASAINTARIQQEP